jgi:hypothetical protein
VAWIATYEEKVAHVKLVAERGAEARKMGDKADQRASRRAANKIFDAMAVEKTNADDKGPGSLLVLSDTPTDRWTGREYGVSRAWARHVRKVFVDSFMAAEPRPTPPAA